MSNLFVKRLKAPGHLDKNYLRFDRGGSNYCIQIKDNGSVLANCVGYAWGRWRELLGGFHSLSRANAEDWWSKVDGYERGQVPRVGAVICWREGGTYNGKDGMGHVAIVEEVKANGNIITSNSAYKGSEFYLREIRAPYNVGGRFVLQGFIYLPGEWVTHILKANAVIADEVIAGHWETGAARVNNLKAAGYDPDVIQKLVNEKLAPKPVKTNEQIAAEVRNGAWGNGEDRVNRLTKAGYDAKVIQSIVNNQNGSKPGLTNEAVARKVINGDYGNGSARTAKLRVEGYDPAVIQSIVNRILG